MPVVIAVVLALGVLVLVNLLLTVGIIRKLRTYERDRAAAPDPSRPTTGLRAGTAVPAFAATARDGSEVGVADLAGRRTLVGFFSSDCEGCTTAAPGFAPAAREAGVAALAVVTAGHRDPEELLAALGDDVTAVVEQGPGSLTEAFAVSAYPWYFLTGPDGVVVASAANSEGCLGEPVRA
ncbi:MAG TPA: redoxin domain-containing protein [Nonomuraea sp.]|nr:redoxin domain-containing protein [Nonomuraea sp.]